MNVTQTNPVARAVGFVLGPPVRWIGTLVERRVRRAAPDLPQPPVWFAPVVAGIAVVGTVVAQLALEDDRRRHPERRERERAEPSQTAERGTTSATDVDDESDEMDVEDALETLDVEHPPRPEKAEVRAAYRSLALETHPDQGGDAERFIAVREAWETVEEQDLSCDGQDGEVTQENDTS